MESDERGNFRNFFGKEFQIFVIWNINGINLGETLDRDGKRHQIVMWEVEFPCTWEGTVKMKKGYFKEGMKISSGTSTISLWLKSRARKFVNFPADEQRRTTGTKIECRTNICRNLRDVIASELQGLSVRSSRWEGDETCKVTNSNIDLGMASKLQPGKKISLSILQFFLIPKPLLKRWERKWGQKFAKNKETSERLREDYIRDTIAANSAASPIQLEYEWIHIQIRKLPWHLSRF